MEKLEIYTSKKKSFLILLISIVFVGLGIWMLIEADNFTSMRAQNPNFTRGIGIVSILFFGLGIFVGIKRLLKSELALVISPEGLNINPKKSLTEFIPWKDIEGFDEIKIQSTRIVIIKLKNANEWLEKETNGFRKKLIQFNINHYNSPFNISASGLKISSDQLLETLNKYYNPYNGKTADNKSKEEFSESKKFNKGIKI